MKKGLSLLLSLLMVVSIITSMPLFVNAANGSSYTSSSVLAAKLDQVFSGDIDIYSNSACTTEVSMPVGTSMSTSTRYWVKSNTTGNTISGWQCYIYANAVYNKLFNEWVGHGDSFSHSQNVITTGKSSVSYSDFVNAGVHTGAYIRTTNNSSGAYNGSSGHSMIVLSYDSSYITYLEGNADGKGLVRITKQTWNEFNIGELSGRTRYISHVVQPTESYYQSLYPTTPQTYTISYNANGGTGAPASQIKTHGVALKLSTTIPTRIGYSLWGWSYTPTGTPPAYSVGGTFEINANTTLYAIWKPNTYTVVYNANGGSEGSTAASSHQYCDSFVTSSGEYYKAYEFMQTGHDLSPVIDSGGTGKYLIEFDLYSDVAGKTRVYAQNGTTAKYGFWQEFDATTNWQHYSFYVDVYLQDESVSQSMLAFYGGYGTGCNPHVKNIVFTKANENLTANSFTRKGYTFLGWSTNPNATTPTYTDKQEIKNLTSVNGATINLYAIWKPNTYSIVYNGNGNTGGSTATSEHQYCDSFVTSSGEYYKAYEFMQTGHDLSPVIDSGGTGKYLVEFDLYSDVAGKMHVYLQNGSTSKYSFEKDFNTTTSWKHYSFFVDVELQDSSVSQSMLAFYGGYGTGCNPHVKNIVFTKANENLSANGFTRKDYSFLGWSTNPNATTPTYTDKQEIKNLTSVNGATVNLYAIWQKNHFHSYTETVTKPATCTENGVKTFTCSCGDSYTESIPASGHRESSWITDKKATVYRAGLKHKECTECGGVVSTEEIAQLKCSKAKLKTIANTTSGVKITWGKVKGADKYRVYRKTSKSDWKYLGSTTKTGYTDKTAKSGTKYYYAIRVRNEAGNSSLSSSLSKYYLDNPTLKTPTSTSNGITIRWNKVAGTEGYMVYRKTGTGSYSKIATVKGTSKVTYIDKSAKKGKKYTYKVKAYKSKTYSAYSGTKTITDKY